jgi:hypothetical protein
MKSLQNQYFLVKEGKISKEHFLKQARTLFPQYVNQYSTFDNTINTLKKKSVLSESMGVVVTKGANQDWIKIFNENITEAAKAIEKETTKEVSDMKIRGYDYTDTKKIDNIYSYAFLEGYYTEIKDPKNQSKTVDDIKDIVAKNLAKDALHYVKNGAFGTKGIGYTDEIPGLGKNTEPKSKNASVLGSNDEVNSESEIVKNSLVGQTKFTKKSLKESLESGTSFYNSLKVGDKAIYDGPEKNGFQKGDEVEVATYRSGPTFQKVLTVKKGNKKLIVKGHNSLKPLNEAKETKSDDKAEKLAKPFIKEAYNEETDALALTFKDENEFERAKEHFENDSDFYPFDINDEFRTFYFQVADQADADSTEFYLTQELEGNTDLQGYFFSTESSPLYMNESGLREAVRSLVKQAIKERTTQEINGEKKEVADEIKNKEEQKKGLDASINALKARQGQINSEKPTDTTGA